MKMMVGDEANEGAGLGTLPSGLSPQPARAPFGQRERERKWGEREIVKSVQGTETGGLENTREVFSCNATRAFETIEGLEET